MVAKKYSAEPNIAGSQTAAMIAGLGLSNVQSYKIPLDDPLGGLLNRLDIPVAASGRQNQLIVRDYGGQVYNVKSAAFGAVGDGVTDDTAAIQTALNLFGSGTGNTGILYFPEGTYLISNTLTFQGSTTSALRMIGAVGATGSGTGAKIKWGGAAGGVMFYILGCNGSSFETLDFDCQSSALYGIWIDATNTTTGSSTAITALSRAANVVTVNVPGHGLTIGNLVTIKITGAVPTTFNVTIVATVADANNLTFSQTGANVVASTPGTVAVVQSGTSSGNRFHQIGVYNPSGTNSACVAIGHTTSGSTPQVSEIFFDECNLFGRQVLNGTYNGILQLSTGNTKNFTLGKCSINGCNVLLNFTLSSGSIQLNECIFSLSQSADITFGSGQLTAIGLASENSVAGAKFLTSTANGASITIQGSYWQGVCAAGDIFLAVAGALTLVNNQFTNSRTGASTPIIQITDPLFNAAGADTIFSQGNWYVNVAAAAFIPVVDGGGTNVVVNGGGGFYGNKAVNVTSIGDFGGATGAMTHISNWIPVKALIAQQSAGTPGISTTGFIRLGNVDALNFRNAANSADLLLISGNASNQASIGAAAGALVSGGPLTLGVLSSATGSLTLANSGSAFTTTLQAGVNITASRTYTWPTDFGNPGTVLTDPAGSGTLTWGAGGGSVVTADQGYFVGGLGTSAFGISPGTAVVSTANQVRAKQFVLCFYTTVGHITWELTTAGAAGAKVDIGIYNAAGTTKLVSTGAQAADGALAISTVAVTAVNLPAGVYYMGWTSSDATVQVRVISGNSQWEALVSNNQTVKKNGIATNVSVAGVLPTSLGSPAIGTAASVNVPLTSWER